MIWKKSFWIKEFWPLQSRPEDSKIHLRFQFSQWEFTQECEGSLSHTLLHSQQFKMWLLLPSWHVTLQALYFGRKPKAKVATKYVYYIVGDVKVALGQLTNGVTEDGGFKIFKINKN